MVYNFGQPFPPPVGSFQVPVVPPDSDADAGDLAVVCFSVAWQPYILGALQQLTLQATWQGDDDAVLLAQSRAQDLIDLFAQLESICPGFLLVKGLLYDPDTDQVEQTTDGGSSYHDTPGYDPRHSSIFLYPPVTADDPQCQAASNMTRWINNLIDETVSTLTIGLDAGGLVTLILGVLVELGPFGILIDLVVALAFALFSAGASAVSAAFTNDVYDQLNCIFFCHIDSSGQVSSAALAAITSDIDAKIGGLVATIMDAMFFLMGENGLANAGTIDGGEPVDCSGCDCTFCYAWDFTITDYAGDGWAVEAPYGQYAAGQGWQTTFGQGLILDLTFPGAPTEVTRVLWGGTAFGGIGPYGRAVLYTLSGSTIYNSNQSGISNPYSQDVVHTDTVDKLRFNPYGGSDADIYIQHVEIHTTTAVSAWSARAC